MARNSSLSLGKHFVDYLESLVKSGAYSSIDDVIRSALSLVEEREQKLAELSQALEAGLECGITANFDASTNLAELHSMHLRNMR